MRTSFLEKFLSLAFRYFLAIGIIALDDDMVGLLGGPMCDKDFILELWFTFTGPIFLDDTVCLLDCRRV